MRLPEWWRVAAITACAGPRSRTRRVTSKRCSPPSWFEDTAALIDECYARTAQAFAEALLRGETAPGTALDKVAAFLVAALELRRERGSLLSFRRGRDLPIALQRRLHEWDQMVRARLKRLLTKGRRDGSLALRNLDSACELILASLMVPDVAVDGPEQRMWDSELVELLLAALSEPHPPEGAAAQECRCRTRLMSVRRGQLRDRRARSRSCRIVIAPCAASIMARRSRLS